MSKKMCLDDFKKNAAENGLPTGKTPLIPYTLPRLHRGKVWFVDFYCFDPVTGRMRRKKYHLNRIKSVKERYDRAAELIAAVTMRLRSGWNVWVQTESTREQTPWTECVGYYRAYCERAAKKGVMKDKTAYGYLNYLDSFLKWMQQNVRPVLYCYQVDVFLLQDFLDYVLIDRERSARTRNNYLTWLSTLCTWMVQKGYLRDNEERIEALQKMVDEYKSAPAPEAGKADSAAARGIMLRHLGIIKMVAETPTEQNREMLRRISAIDGETNGGLVDWEKVFEMIDGLYSGFYSRLHRQYGDRLSRKEEQIIVLMVAGFSTKEISVITGQTTSTIYVRKSAIRKKLGVPEKEDIVAYLRNRDKD